MDNMAQTDFDKLNALIAQSLERKNRSASKKELISLLQSYYAQNDNSLDSKMVSEIQSALKRRIDSAEVMDSSGLAIAVNLAFSMFPFLRIFDFAPVLEGIWLAIDRSNHKIPLITLSQGVISVLEGKFSDPSTFQGQDSVEFFKEISRKLVEILKAKSDEKSLSSEELKAILFALKAVFVASKNTAGFDDFFGAVFASTLDLYESSDRSSSAASVTLEFLSFEIEEYMRSEESLCMLCDRINTALSNLQNIVNEHEEFLYREQIADLTTATDSALSLATSFLKVLRSEDILNGPQMQSKINSEMNSEMNSEALKTSIQTMARAFDDLAESLIGAKKSENFEEEIGEAKKKILKAFAFLVGSVGIDFIDATIKIFPPQGKGKYLILDLIKDKASHTKLLRLGFFFRELLPAAKISFSDAAECRRPDEKFLLGDSNFQLTRNQTQSAVLDSKIEETLDPGVLDSKIIFAKSAPFRVGFAIFECFAAFCRGDKSAEGAALVEERWEEFFEIFDMTNSLQVKTEFARGLINLEESYEGDKSVLGSIFRRYFPRLMKAAGLYGFPKNKIFLEAIQTYVKHASESEIRPLLENAMIAGTSGATNSDIALCLDSMVEREFESEDLRDSLQKYIFERLEKKKEQKRSFKTLSAFLTHQKKYILENFEAIMTFLKKHKTETSSLRMKIDCSVKILTAISEANRLQFISAFSDFLPDVFVAIKEKNGKTRKSAVKFSAFVVKNFVGTKIDQTEIFDIIIETAKTSKPKSKSGPIELTIAFYEQISPSLSPEEKLKIFESAKAYLLPKTPSKLMRKDETKSLLALIKAVVKSADKESLAPLLPSLASLIAPIIKPTPPKNRLKMLNADLKGADLKNSAQKSILRPKSAGNRIKKRSKTDKTGPKIEKIDRNGAAKFFQTEDAMAADAITERNSPFLSKVKVILERLIKKYSEEEVRNCLPPEASSVVRSVIRRMGRARRTDKMRKSARIATRIATRNAAKIDGKSVHYPAQNPAQNLAKRRGNHSNLAKTNENFENLAKNGVGKNSGRVQFFDGLYEDSNGKIIVEEKEVLGRGGNSGGQKNGRRVDDVLAMKSTKRWAEKNKRQKELVFGKNGQKNGKKNGYKNGKNDFSGALRGPKRGGFKKNGVFKKSNKGKKDLKSAFLPFEAKKLGKGFRKF